MRCAFCEKEVVIDGEPTPIYTGDLYQSYVHFDGEVVDGVPPHSGFSRRVTKK